MIDLTLNFSLEKIEKEPDVYEEQTYHNVNRICDEIIKDSDILLTDLDEKALRKFVGKESLSEQDNVD